MLRNWILVRHYFVNIAHCDAHLGGCGRARGSLYNYIYNYSNHGAAFPQTDKRKEKSGESQNAIGFTSSMAVRTNFPAFHIWCGAERKLLIHNFLRVPFAYYFIYI